ncbi:MAG: hypothetical protein KGN84_20755 [Acidobacteriota bacterium]|nr:hypothetical protein [Acidobacteriota bacterium]
MHDSPNPSWREVIERHHSTLVDELAASLDSAFDAERVRSTAEIERVRREAAVELDTARSRAAEEIERERGRAAAEMAAECERSALERESERAVSAADLEHLRIETASQIERRRQEIIGYWNQNARRFRQTDSHSAILRLLAEIAAEHATRLVVVMIENGQVVERRGIHERELIVPVRESAAIAEAIDTRDPVVAAVSASEISAPLAEAFAESGGKAYLFPLVTRQEVMAVLLASGDVQPVALELLSGMAALRIEGLVASEPKKAAVVRSGWDALSEEDQRLHLQAQRVARVKVAELRLYHADELRKGVAERNIYGTLEDQIETIRTLFLQTFLSKTPTMVDYLHLELVRSLAHDDERLLGESYPGPMV